jgi:hypothetical protein
LWTRNTRSADTAKAQIRDTAFVRRRVACVSAPTKLGAYPQDYMQFAARVSMNSPIEHRREGARHERAISSLGDRTGAPLFVKVLDSLIGSFVPKLTNATRMLKEQLRADGVGVWVSAGCLAEFARIASLAAARTRQGDESYESCLRREIVTHSRFIREWTSSDEKFDPTRGELISIARRFALPRAWRVSEAVASVRGQTAAGASDALLAVGKKAAEVVAVARPRPRGIPKNTH